MLHSLLRPLAERGHKITVLEGWEPLAGHPEYIHDGYDIDGIRVEPYRGPQDPFPYLPTTDLFITHLQQTQRAVSLAPWVKKKCIVLCHNTFDETAHYLDPRFLHIVLPVYNSLWQKEFLEKPYTKSHPNSLVVRPPVYVEDYHTTPGDCIALLNLNSDKGAHVFWELSKRMRDVKFLGVVGAHGIQIIPKKIPKNVKLVQHSSDMKSVYGQIKILLVPSIYESYGRVVQEAYASGIPAICSPTPGLLENAGEAGIFIDRDDLDGYEAKIRSLLSNPEEWQAVSKKALARSAEMEKISAQDLLNWVSFVEGAGYLGR